MKHVTLQYPEQKLPYYTVLTQHLEKLSVSVCCSKRLSDMMTHMKERLAGKIGNANNNAFMLRKLFKMYDTAGSGYVSVFQSTVNAMMHNCT